MQKSIVLRRSRGRFGSLITWKPLPLIQPRVNSSFQNMSLFHRAVESIRYNLASIEYWISPDGGLRELVGKITALGLVASLGWGAFWLLTGFACQVQSLLFNVILFLGLAVALVTIIKLLPRLLRSILSKL